MINIGDYVKINIYPDKYGIVSSIHLNVPFPYAVSFIGSESYMVYNKNEICKIIDENLINKLKKIQTFK